MAFDSQPVRQRSAITRCVVRRTGVIRRPSGRRIRLILGDDQPIALAGLDALFSRESEFLVLQRCTNEPEVVRAVIAHRPDVVLLHRNLPPTDAVTVLRTLRAEGVTVRAVLLRDRPNGDHFEWALRLGVYGVAFKTMDPRLVIDCVRDVFDGKRRLGRDEGTRKRPWRSPHCRSDYSSPCFITRSTSPTRPST